MDLPDGLILMFTFYGLLEATYNPTKPKGIKNHFIEWLFRMWRMTAKVESEESLKDLLNYLINLNDRQHHCQDDRHHHYPHNNNKRRL